MSIEIELPLSPSTAEEPCPFTLWLVAEDAETKQHRQAIAAAEKLMTDLPEPHLEAMTPAADTFLGQWL
jgi:hypothetical protein